MLRSAGMQTGDVGICALRALLDCAGEMMSGRKHRNALRIFPHAGVPGLVASRDFHANVIPGGEDRPGHRIPTLYKLMN